MNTIENNPAIQNVLDSIRIIKPVEASKTSLSFGAKEADKINLDTANKIDSSGQFVEAYRWVWVKKDKCFFDTRDCTQLSVADFNNHYLDKTILIEKKKKNKKGEDEVYLVACKPAEYARKHLKIHDVSEIKYRPSEQPVYAENNIIYVSPFDRRFLVKPSRKNYDDVKKAFYGLVDYLIGDRPEVKEYFLSTLAYMIQNTGKRVEYFTLIQGEGGIGKSTISLTLEAMIGIHNFFNIEEKNVKDSFNGPFFKNLLVSWEEVKTRDSSLMENIKVLLTGKYGAIREMRKEARKQELFANYIGTTNYKDAFKLTDSQAFRRRFFIIFANPTKTNTWTKEQFSHYYDLLDKYPGTFKQVLLDHKIHERYNPRRALDTPEFDHMSTLSEDELDMAIDELIVDESSHLITDEVISYSHLKDSLEGKSKKGDFDPARIKHKLSERGYTQHGQPKSKYRIQISGSKYNLFGKSNEASDKLLMKDLIFSSVKEGFENAI